MTVKHGVFKAEDLVMCTVQVGERYRCFTCSTDIDVGAGHPSVGEPQVPRCPRCGGLTGFFAPSKTTN